MLDGDLKDALVNSDNVLMLKGSDTTVLSFQDKEGRRMSVDTPPSLYVMGAQSVTFETLEESTSKVLTTETVNFSWNFFKMQL